MFTSRLNKLAYRWATRLFRRKRFGYFQKFIAHLPRPLTVLDIGGSQDYWNQMESEMLGDVRLTLLNLNLHQSGSDSVDLCFGDARCLPFTNNSFDLVFSNSVIEHLGDASGQIAMVEEIQRVGCYYFVQTPNQNFPLEPHFLIPFFQFLPRNWQAWLLYRLRVEYFEKRILTLESARQVADEIVMLTKKEFQSLFPDGELVSEKVLGLTKSFMIFGKC